MRAVTFQEIEKVEVNAKAPPVLAGADEAIVAVELAGLCGSDLHPYRGAERGLDPGTTMGHEFVGRVIAVGPEVKSFRPGDAVMSPFSTSCGSCPRCRRGLTARCARGQVFGWIAGGRGLEGAQAERVRVPLADSTLVARPPGLAPLEALLVGDVVATGFAAVERIGEVGAARGEPLVVIGLGAVGLAAVLAGLHHGYRPVIAVDGIAERLELAAELGAVPVAAAASAAATAAEVARELGAGEARAIVEAVGSDGAVESAAAIAAPGAVVSSVGVHTSARLPLAPPALYDKNLTLRFGRCSARARMERVAALVAGSRLPVARLVTRTVPLADAADAYRMFASRQPGWVKAVFEVAGGS